MDDTEVVTRRSDLEVNNEVRQCCRRLAHFVTYASFRAQSFRSPRTILVVGCRNNTSLTGLFDQWVVVADHYPVNGSKHVELDHVHAESNGFDERNHCVALKMPLGLIPTPESKTYRVETHARRRNGRFVYCKSYTRLEEYSSFLGL